MSWLHVWRSKRSKPRGGQHDAWFPLDVPCPAIVGLGLWDALIERHELWLEGEMGEGGIEVRRGPKAPLKRTPFDAPSPSIAAHGVGSAREYQAHVVVGDAPPPARSAKPPFRLPTMAEVRAVPKDGPTHVSTFSGAGGSCLGFALAGYKTLWANDCDPKAVACYRANFNSPIDDRPIQQLEPGDVLKATGLAVGELDVLEGSPPCTAFSTAGRRDKGWRETKEHAGIVQRNVEDLFFQWLRLVEGLRPKAFVAENVAGLARGRTKGKYLQILAAMRALGYKAEARVLDAQWLGVPQTRARLFFVGVRGDLPWDPAQAFPRPLPFRYSVRDALPHLWSLVHDTSGLRGQGEVIDKPAPAVTGGQEISSHLVPCHFRAADVRIEDGVQHQMHDAEAPTTVEIGVAQVKNRAMKPEARSLDEPASAIRASGPSTLGGKIDVRVIHDAGGDFGVHGDVSDRPAPTVLGEGAHRTTNFAVEEVEVSDGRPHGSERSRPGDEPSVCIEAEAGRRMEVRRRVRVQSSGARDDWKPGDEPAPCVEASPGAMVEVDGSRTDDWRDDQAHPCGAQVPSRVRGKVVRRKLTIPEVMALCSFPPDFVLLGKYTDQWARLGNSVPPLMALAMARGIREAFFDGKG